MITREDLKAKIRELRPRIKETTISNYISLMNQVGAHLLGTRSHHEIQEFDYLLDLEGILDWFEEKNYSQVTRRSYLGKLITVFEAFNSLNNWEYSIIQDEYNEILETYVLEAKADKEENPNQATERQKKNWLEWSEIVKVFEAEKLNCEYFELPKENMNYDEKTLFNNMFILALYCADPDNPPLRNDYAEMRVVDEEPENDELNYLVLNEPMRFIFNDYKTNKSYGQQVIKVGKKLRPILDKYLKYKVDGEFLLYDLYNNPMSKNTMTQRITKIFKNHTGKNISTQILRHSYITEHIPPQSRQQKKLAAKMLHSPQMNMEYSLYLN